MRLSRGNTFLLVVATALSCFDFASSQEQAVQAVPVKYGADISFPMLHDTVSTNYPWLPHNVDPANNPTPPQYKDMPIQPLGDMMKKYNDYINGCVEFYGSRGDRCTLTEQERIEMSARQVKSMNNYTQLGYAKIRAPDHVFTLLQKFWQANKDRQSKEAWPVGNIYTNHWSAQSTMVSVEDPNLEGGGYILKQHIWNAARDTISEWTGQALAECSLYGIRVYHEGSILSPHVDRLPLVASAIINVDQDTDEPWPLEVIGHDGFAVNVTMEPGDMVLYESHSILHGRPFPLKGRYMANVFIHFEPIGPLGGEITYTGDLPPYVIPGSEEEPNWRKNHPDGHTILGNKSFATGSTVAHHLAMSGDIDGLERHLDKVPHHVNVKDKNGWTILHEAVRHGDLRMIQMVLDRGADINTRTGSHGEGGSAMWWALKFHDPNSEVVKLLESRQGKSYSPEL